MEIDGWDGCGKGQPGKCLKFSLQDAGKLSNEKSAPTFWYKWDHKKGDEKSEGQKKQRMTISLCLHNKIHMKYWQATPISRVYMKCHINTFYHSRYRPQTFPSSSPEKAPPDPTKTEEKTLPRKFHLSDTHTHIHHTRILHLTLWHDGGSHYISAHLLCFMYIANGNNSAIKLSYIVVGEIVDNISQFWRHLNVFGVACSGWKMVKRCDTAVGREKFVSKWGNI